MSVQKKYHAFISYRHADNKEQGRQWATWLHQAIETYEIPADLVGKKNGQGETIPSRIYPIFRDEEELPADADLGKSIYNALDSTRLLIVLCSPRAVVSTYVADEIDYFKKCGNSDRIIAAMIDGEPNASWDKGKQEAGFKIEDECFPVPLQFEYDKQGNKTTKHAEPIAADFRINNNGVPEQGWTSIEAYRQHLKSTTKLDNKQTQEKLDTYQKQQNLMLLKIIAGILGVPLSELTQRDKAYQLEQANKKTKILRRWLIAVFILAFIAIGAGVLAYFKQQEALHEKEVANNMLDIVRENLDFMNFELRWVLEKHVPSTNRVEIIKKIDSLVDLLSTNGTSLSDRYLTAVSNFNKIDTLLLNKDIDISYAIKLANESHKIILQLQLENKDNLIFKNLLSISYMKLGDIHLKTGLIKEANYNYGESLNIINQLVEISPKKQEYLHSLSINLIKIADIQVLSVSIEKALASYKESLISYNQLMELDSINTIFKREASILYLKIGATYEQKNDNDNAYFYYQPSLKILKELALAAPNNNLLKIDLTTVLNRIANIQLQLGFKDKAFKNYEESLKIDNNLAENDPENIEYQKNLIISNYSLAKLYSKFHDYKKALEYIDTSLVIVVKNKAKLSESTKEEFLRAISTDAAQFSMKLNKYEIATKYLQNYFISENIYVRNKALTPEKVIVLKTRIAEYLNWSWYMLFTDRTVNTIPTLINVISYLNHNDERIIYLYGNLAHAYILSNDYDSAKEIYTQFKGQEFPDGRSWDTVTIEDFKALKDEGIEHPDFTKIAKEVFGVDGF